jgi:hypothetical protein
VAHCVGSKMSALVPLLVFKRTFGQQPRLTTAHPWKSARRKKVFSSPFAGAPKHFRSRGRAVRCSGSRAPRPAAIRRYARESANTPSAPARRQPPPPGRQAHQAPRARPAARSASRSIPGFSALTDPPALRRAAARGRRCTWQVKSQQLRVCQAQGSPISGARIFDRRVMDHHHRPM